MRDVSLLYGPVRNWMTVAGAALIAVLIGFVATGSAEQRVTCEVEAETLAAAEASYWSTCGATAEPVSCDATAGAWRCSDDTELASGVVRRSSSPQWRSPDLVFAAGGTAIWTAIAPAGPETASSGSDSEPPARAEVERRARELANSGTATSPGTITPRLVGSPGNPPTASVPIVVSPTTVAPSPETTAPADTEVAGVSSTIQSDDPADESDEANDPADEANDPAAESAEPLSSEPPTQTACTASGRNLRQAQRAYAALCSAPRVDCDPVANGSWLCSSARIGGGAPNP